MPFYRSSLSVMFQTNEIVRVGWRRGEGRREGGWEGENRKEGRMMVFGKLLECVRGRPKLLALNNLILAQAQSPAILCWLKKCRMDMAYESPPPIYIPESGLSRFSLGVSV